MSTDITASGWFRIEIPCLDISLQVSFQDSQDEQNAGQGGVQSIALGSQDLLSRHLIESQSWLFTPPICISSPQNNTQAVD